MPAPFGIVFAILAHITLNIPKPYTKETSYAALKLKFSMILLTIACVLFICWVFYGSQLTTLAVSY
jgi:hypothetical protein